MFGVLKGHIMIKKLKYLFIAVTIMCLIGAFTYVIHISLQAGNVVRVTVTTTTSLYVTGLLDYLANEFRKQYPNVMIDFIAVGSGEALERAARGDACMVFVHAPSLERRYIDKGVITNHLIIAYNYFVIVGPEDDPVGIKYVSNVAEAFKRIYEAGEKGLALFVSRGDMSGTHVKELSIWNITGLNPQGRPWYRETGSGMGKTLVVANELRAYTLSDIGTYLMFKEEGRIPYLEILYMNDSMLINIYSIYIVKQCIGVERTYAEKFARFIYEHQDLIGRYGIDKYGQPLFYPAKEHEEKLYRIWSELSRE